MYCSRFTVFVYTLTLAAGLTPLPLRAQALPNPPPSHVVVVIMENHSASQIIGSPDAPYINALAAQGAVFTQSYAITHPSQPNYVALFSGSTHQIVDDRCPLSLPGSNLAQQLIAAGKTFAGYSEGLPSVGFKGCATPAGYARKHAPWVNFPELPASVNRPLTAFPSGHYHRLPTVSFVVPNVQHDMHDGTVAQGDAWLKVNLDPYVQWSKTHNGLMIVTWDEDNGAHGNQVPTLFIGPMVKPGAYSTPITHYSVLRTLEALYGLPRLGEAAAATTITAPW
jgi:acid phosphatase